MKGPHRVVFIVFDFFGDSWQVFAVLRVVLNYKTFEKGSYDIVFQDTTYHMWVQALGFARVSHDEDAIP